MDFDLSIVLLVWRDRAFLPACLEALARARGCLALEIIVVENGITLEANEYAPPEFAASQTPIRRIHNPQNRGVALARNQGLDAARGRYLMLLDVDTVVTQDALVNLVHYMDANPQVGLAGPRLQDAQGNLQRTCRRLPTVWSKILRRLPTRWAQNALADEMLATYDHRTPRDVDYVIGACQIIRRRAYGMVGALDAQFFYGPEDVDYCLRMWQRHWRVAYVPQAVVIHREQRLTQQRAFSKLALLHAWGLARYFWKHKYLFTRPSVEQAPSILDADAISSRGR
jgi:N-acetylglucosaminyl-diphospho-decaprenol L-rhamnosyltransferase